MERIEINPRKMGGKPVIKGTRIPVYFILELLANGWSFEDILENYPQLTREDILAAIRYASMILKEEQYVGVFG
ncbi:antitoxin [Thermococcus gorgonarius]|uniref:Antitoxin n=2 Tax=Thermococcus gorgonarius TaxID=71997 RepID=A0A2Z2M899_THEGO|nr:antitoxin [Thermococcus gorgonarius]